MYYIEFWNSTGGIFLIILYEKIAHENIKNWSQKLHGSLDSFSLQLPLPKTAQD